jgi:hypothetical protein
MLALPAVAWAFFPDSHIQQGFQAKRAEFGS